MRDQGYDLAAFSMKFKLHCRRFCNSAEAEAVNRSWEDAACEKMAEITGENLTIIRGVHRGEHAPTQTLLDHMGWIKYDDFEVREVRVQVERYLPTPIQSVVTTKSPVYPL